jgi:hypothetical protein
MVVSFAAISASIFAFVLRFQGLAFSFTSAMPSITLVTSLKSCPETNYDVLLLILCVPTLPSASHHLIPDYLHIPQHKVVWNLPNPFGVDLLTKSIFTKMKLRLNCKLQKLQGHDIEDFPCGYGPTI